MEIYTTNKGKKIAVTTKYLIRYISEYGLIKTFKRFGDEVANYSYSTKEEAIEEIAKNEFAGAVILEQISLDYYPKE